VSGTPAQTPSGPPVPVQQETLNTILADLQDIKGGVSDLKSGQATQADDIRDLKRRVEKLEDQTEAHSKQGRAGSQVDLEHAAALSKVETRLDSLESSQANQTRILELLEKGAASIIASPHVKVLVGVLWTALLTYLATKGLIPK
jgi:chromosome segregation ATPase